MTTPRCESFSCTTNEVLRRIQLIDPRAYDKTRNYLDGSVTWLSPFLTHGITNTYEVAQQVLHERKPSDCHRLLFELGWREYFHSHKQYVANQENINKYSRSTQRDTWIDVPYEYIESV